MCLRELLPPLVPAGPVVRDSSAAKRFYYVIAFPV